MPGFEGTTVQSVPHFCTVVQEAWPADERPGVHVHFCLHLQTLPLCPGSAAQPQEELELHVPANVGERGKNVLNWIV